MCQTATSIDVFKVVTSHTTKSVMSSSTQPQTDPFATMDFPTPLVVEPAQLPHKQTFVLLHGRGSTGDKFGPVLLETPLASHAQTLRTAFPHARFVFPTAARRRATVYRRAYTHQWFNNWKLDPPATDREDLQTDGLRETTAFLHRLLRAEISLVPGGAKNVVFGGLSQGCAASLVATLLWEGDKLAAWVGMCGWLPFAERLMEQQIEPSQGTDDDDDDLDPFGSNQDDEGEQELTTPAARAVGWLREELDLPASSSDQRPPLLEMPLFWSHGAQDDRVSILLGRRGWECVRGMGGRLTTAEYEDLGHWYSPDMLSELTRFLQAQGIEGTGEGSNK